MVLICNLVFFFCALVFFLIAPNIMKPKKEFGDLFDFYYAHRGQKNKQFIENSLDAFSDSVAHSCGIELDVQLTKDLVPVIFHDFTLERMTGQKGEVGDYTLEELKRFPLLNSNCFIPTLEEVLQVVDKKVPLLIELKSMKPRTLLSKKTAEVLKEYHGAYMIESFNPCLLYYFRRYQKDIVRVQLNSKLEILHKATVKEKLVNFLLNNLLLNCIARPDIISVKIQDKDRLCCKTIRKFFSARFACWTVESQEELEIMENQFDFSIFEGFEPKSAQPERSM